MNHHDFTRRNTGLDIGSTVARFVFPSGERRKKERTNLPERLHQDVGLSLPETRTRWEDYL